MVDMVDTLSWSGKDSFMEITNKVKMPELHEQKLLMALSQDEFLLCSGLLLPLSSRVTHPCGSTVSTEPTSSVPQGHLQALNSALEANKAPQDSNFPLSLLLQMSNDRLLFILLNMLFSRAAFFPCLDSVCGSVPTAFKRGCMHTQYCKLNLNSARYDIITTPQKN